MFRKLKDHTLISKASIDSESLVSYITSAKLDSKCRGTSHAFVLHWYDQVQVYEKMLPPADHFSGAVKMTLLQNTVANSDDLDQVKLCSKHDKANGYKPLSYQSYKAMVLSVCSIYNCKRGSSNQFDVCKSMITKSQSPFWSPLR